jgi:poly(beta-D-mannuronate) lyase
VPLVWLGCALPSYAATHNVDSITSLQQAINDAAPGDVIIVKNGTYTTTKSISVSRRATADHPITIAAETVGGVEITGSNGFNVVQPAAHVIIQGFVFKHASGKNTIAAGTSHVRFTRNVFHCTGDGPYLGVLGDDAQVDYNEFRDKKSVGNMLSVSGTGSQVARRLWVHHNYFHDFSNAGANGAETIRFGLSQLSLSTGAGLVEHNLFIRCNGENELISNKSCGNTYRYNTILDSPNAQLTLRHGNECLVYGNYLRNTEGIRIFGDRHQIFSNYLEKNYMGINLGNGGAEVADGAPLTSHDRPDNCVISFNTLVENRTQYQMSRRTPTALGATNTTFANNILLGGIAAKIEGPYTGAVWSGNIVWKASSPGDFPAEGFSNEDPKLVAGDDGILRLQEGSPAIDAAVGEYPEVKFDFEGQPRSERKDKGADEFSTAPVIARILTVNDVGPNAKPSASPTGP